MNEKNIMTQTEKNEETKINRLMLFFALAAIAVVALLLINKNVPLYYREAAVILHVIPWLKIVSVIALAVSAFFWFINRKKSAGDDVVRIFSNTTWMALSAMLVAIAFSYEYFRIPGAVTIIIAFLVLAFIESIYSKDFFAYSVYTCIGAVLLYVCGKTNTVSVFKNILKYGIKALAIVIPVLVIVIGAMLIKNGGKIGKLSLLKPGYKLYPFFITSAVILASAVLSFIFSSLMIYAIIAVFAVYLIMAIVYTVKMM